MPSLEDAVAPTLGDLRGAGTIPSAGQDAVKFRSRWTQLQLNPEEGVEMLGRVIPMEAHPVSSEDYEKRYHKVMIPLSLFAPHVGEEKQIQERINKAAPPERHEIPLKDHLKIPPTTSERFLEIMALRVHPMKEVQHTSVSDQEDLIRILGHGVQNKWLDALCLPPVPTFSAAQNKEVLRRMALGTILICENIFRSYLQKADILNKRGIFSTASNMTRLRTQLGVDVSDIIDMGSLKRHVVAQIRQETAEGSVPASFEDVVSGAQNDDDEVFKLTTRASKRIPGMTADAKPTAFPLKRLQEKTLDVEPIKKLMAPYLQLHKELATAVPKKSTANSRAISSTKSIFKFETPSSPISSPPGGAEWSGLGTTRQSAADAPPPPPPLLPLSPRSSMSSPTPRCTSMPELRLEEETLAAELGLHSDDEIESGRRTVDPWLKVSDVGSDDEEGGVSMASAHHPGAATGTPGSWSGRVMDDRQHRRLMTEDLARLTASGPEGVRDDVCEVGAAEGDLPPLLQAIVRSSKHDGKRETLRLQLEEIEARERARAPSQQPLAPPTHAQPAVVAMHVPQRKLVVQASDLRISNRSCLAEMTIDLYPPIFNDLVGEIDLEDISSLDQNLFMKNEISEVYQELMKTVPKDHQELGRDQLLTEPAPWVPLNQVLASTSLRTTAATGRVKRLVNPDLRKNVRPPWEQKGRVEEWIKTAAPTVEAKGAVIEARRQSRQLPSIVGVGFRGEELKVPDVDAVVEAEEPPAQDVADATVTQKASRAYNSWLAWWKNTLNSDDYMKFLATQDSDFVSHLFHLYDSDVSDEEEDDIDEDGDRGSDRLSSHSSRAKTNKSKSSKNDPLRALREEDPAVIAREEMRQVQDYFQECEAQLHKMKTQKAVFQQGIWNCGTVLIGGLGKDPDLKDLEELGLTSDMPKPKTDVAAVLKEELTTKLKREDSKAKLRHKIGGSGQPSPQERLERVWTMLRLPDRMKLDMAVKYSSDELADKLMPSLRAWESAAKLIVERETLMAKLESLEDFGSNPNRFYSRGFLGSSRARFKEGARRDAIHRQMDALQRKIEDRQKYLWENFQDVLTYDGRGYMEKMQWDKTEMLYYLQEERRRKALTTAMGRKRGDDHSSAETKLEMGQSKFLSTTTLPPPSSKADLASFYIPTAPSMVQSSMGTRSLGITTASSNL